MQPIETVICCGWSKFNIPRVVLSGLTELNPGHPDNLVYNTGYQLAQLSLGFPLQLHALACDGGGAVNYNYNMIWTMNKVLNMILEKLNKTNIQPNDIKQYDHITAMKDPNVSEQTIMWLRQMKHSFV